MATLLTSVMLYAAKPLPLGASLGAIPNPTVEQLVELQASGIEYIEVVMNNFFRTCPPQERYTRAYAQRNIIERSGIKVWSCHLPFSRTIDISQSDEAKREESVQLIAEAIRLSKIFNPQRLVLHPSSEPIDDNEREERIAHSIESIGRLATVARETGAVLCIEDLPRTCLGRNSAELMRLIDNYPEVMVCFDSNHLLTESHKDFFAGVGQRIGTIHASDYDRVDERHWMPGKGVIDWTEFYGLLTRSGYKGVFMLEVRNKSYTSSADAMEAYRKILVDFKNSKKRQ